MTNRSTVLRGSDAARATDAFSSTLTAFDPVKVKAAIDPTEAVEEATAAGFQQGYADGLDAAHQAVLEATEDANKRVRRALAALCDAVEQFDQRQTLALADVENEIVTAAVAIASSILKREISVATDPGAEAIARAMAFAPDRGEVIARLHPLDAETLSMDNVSTGNRTVQVLADPNVEPGGCIAEIGDTRIDAQLSSALAKVAQVLGVAAE